MNVCQTFFSRFYCIKSAGRVYCKRFLKRYKVKFKRMEPSLIVVEIFFENFERTNGNSKAKVADKKLLSLQEESRLIIIFICNSVVCDQDR